MPGRILGGRYTVQDKVGTGGMAIVYRGLDQVLGRIVAIKTMLPQYATDPSFAARFKQEAQAAAALQSPYIVSVYDWGKDGDTYYIVMEYLRGTDLKSGIRKHGALDCKKVAQIGSQIAQALSVAHKHDIIHRDIKPQNIMVQPDGNIKVMDFGIARAKNSHLTTDNSVLGTAHYVSPEQTQGKELGPTTDIYSLGVVMYEAATGTVPFDGDDAITVALKQVNEQPQPPSQRNPAVDPSLEGIILKCMQKNPADRFQTADELVRVLHDYLAGRLQAVNNATALLPVTPTTKLGDKTSSTTAMPHVSQGSGRSSRGHRTTATELARQQQEENEKKHRRHMAIGIAIGVVAAVAIAIGIFYLLSSSSGTKQVPNLVGLSQDDAIAQINSTNWFTAGDVKEEYSDSVAEGKVIDQDPAAGKSFSKGTQITLYVSKGAEPAADETVPDLSGMTASEAEAALAKYNLVSKAGDGVYSSDVEVGKVAQQNPAAGTSVKAGDTVTYQLSLGPETVDVPDVTGESESAATSDLKAAGFAVSSQTAESDSVDKGYVIKQSPTGSAEKGSTVTITVSSGSSKVSVPDVVGKSESSASSALENAGFSVNVAYASSSSVSSGDVISSSPGSGSLAKKGSTVTITVSTGSSTSPSDNTNNTTDDNKSSDNNSSSSSNTNEESNSGKSNSDT